MPLPFAINGLGRIGRAVLRIAHARDSLELVAVNELATSAQLEHLIRRDSLHGTFNGQVEAAEKGLRLDRRTIPFFNRDEPADIPWQDTPARVVIDATGKCLTRESAESHRRGNVEKIVVSANARGMDLTVCVGVNDRDYNPRKHHLLSGASCTTNCLAPIAYLLDREFGIERGMLNTVHSYNNDQRLLEFPHKDPRRARAAALNMIPTTTSAVEAVERVLPALAGKLAGLAVRVPTPNVSLIDLVVDLHRNPSINELNQTFKAAAAQELEGILATTNEPLVSSDFMGNPHSGVVDLLLTQKVGDSLYRIVAWYDNEWGHAARLVDLLELLAGSLKGATA